MKTLFRKDLRENFRLALIGLGIVTLLIVIYIRSCAHNLEQIAIGENANGSDNKLHPLFAEAFLMNAAFFCAIFGAALGWFQARNEAHRDLWAFLIHRPATRTQIFSGKAAAGLCLYFFGAGLPLLGMVCYFAAPGLFAAPFEPAMALPLFAIFLTGIGYYFAGLLIGLRQARWFGSRTFGLAAALCSSFAAFGFVEFWQTALLTVIAVAVTAIAAWGAYQSSGFYRGQPVAGRLALTVLLTIGCFFLLAALVFLSETLFSRNQSYRWRNYVMDKDGHLFVMVSYQGKQTYVELDGKPVIDPATGEPLTQKKFNEHDALSISTFADQQGNQWDWAKRYNADTKFFTLWTVSGKTLWYVDRHGKLMGFNGITRQRVEDIVPRETGVAVPFIRSSYWHNYFSTYNLPTILCTAATVYRLDVSDRTLTPLFTATPGDPILAFADQNYFPATLVLTHDFVRLIHRGNGSNLLALPYSPDAHSYPQVEVSQLTDSTNRFAVWFRPDWFLNEKADGKMPIHISWASPESKVTRSLDLPELKDPQVETISEKIMDAFAPPALEFTTSHFSVRMGNYVCLIPAALCTLLALRLVRRYNFATGPAVGWVAFVFLLGVPALLAFLFAQDWPKRERCLNCGNFRTVDHENCEHCHAAFPPPDKTGIEIFESVST